jgi:UDP-N-acetylglucosamine 2-epimerase
VKCVTLRDNTERPETVDVKSNVLSGANAEKMLRGASQMAMQGNAGAHCGRVSQYSFVNSVLPAPSVSQNAESYKQA